MTKSNPKKNDLKDKTKKALHRLRTINHDVGKINDQLVAAEEILRDISADKDKILEDFILKSHLESSQKKQRSMVENIPKRIEFKFNGLKFYIDFTVVASERDDLIDMKGSIIYGARRTLCFSDCIYPNLKKQNNCERCERIARCDGLEDKPLISFEVTKHGMIKSSGKLEGEWWIEDKSKSDLVELHYRALDLIWKEALDWANEIILP